MNVRNVLVDHHRFAGYRLRTPASGMTLNRPGEQI